jgi:hypothetical protein
MHLCSLILLHVPEYCCQNAAYKFVTMWVTSWSSRQIQAWPSTVEYQRAVTSQLSLSNSSGSLLPSTCIVRGHAQLGEQIWLMVLWMGRVTEVKQGKSLYFCTQILEGFDSVVSWLCCDLCTLFDNVYAHWTIVPCKGFNDTSLLRHIILFHFTNAQH